MADIEISANDKKKVSHSLHGLAGALFSRINIKVAGLLFLTYIVLNTDVFITRVLSHINGAVADNPYYPSTKGTIIIGLLLVMSYIVFDALVRVDII